MKTFTRLTPDKYLAWCNEEMQRKIKSGHYGSPIEMLFICDDESFIDDYDYWEFTHDNWNGGDILRHLLVDHWEDDTNLVKIYWYIIDGQTYIFVHKDYDFYEISWYKSRGTTEKIYKNGNPISLSEYIELYNELYDEWESGE